MGGFSSAIGEAVDKAIPKLTEHLSTITKGISDRLVPAATVLERTDEGKFFKSEMLQKRYYPLLNQGKEYGAMKANQFIDSEVKVGRTPGKVDVGAIIGKAQKNARAQTLGPNDVNGVALVHSVYKKHGQLAAESLSNAISYTLKDYSMDQKGAAYSPFKANVRKAGIPIRDAKPVYIPVSRTENAVSSILNSTFAPAIAIVHTSTILNGMLGTTPDKFLKETAKSLTFTLDQDIEKQEALLITGGHADHHLEDLREWNLFKATGVPKWRANSAAYYLYKGLHQPGFSPLRDYTRLSGVRVAQTTLTDLADKFAKNPQDKGMMFSLNKWGINPQDVLKQRGVLTQRQLENGIYQYLDNHYFLDNTMYRSPLFGGTPVGRILGMYHSYVTRQARLMARSATDIFRGQGMLAYARNLAIMTTLFPVMGEIIKLTQMGVRGQDAVGQGEQDYDNITGQGNNGIYDSAGTYFEAMGHMGSFGIYNHLLRGGYFHSIMDEFGGPVVSAADRLQSDTSYLARHSDESLADSAAPLARDLSYDTPGVSSLAYVLNHRLLPKANEDPDQDPARQLYNWFQTKDEAKDSNSKAATQTNPN